jgi:hypothetical protein
MNGLRGRTAVVQPAPPTVTVALAAVREDWCPVCKAHTSPTGAPGRTDSAFALATPAVHDGMRLRPGRVVEGARAFRCTCTSTTRPGIVRDFDTLLHDT